MNPLLSKLQPYPFERLRQLFAGVTPPAQLRPISLGMGEPRHPTPAFIQQALVQSLAGLANYPSTAGEPRLRQACAGWLQRRYGVTADPATQVIPVLGSREALFALAQTVIDPTLSGATVVCPNPLYQIYEGAALLVCMTVIPAALLLASYFIYRAKYTITEEAYETMVREIAILGGDVGKFVQPSVSERLYVKVAEKSLSI